MVLQRARGLALAMVTVGAVLGGFACGGGSKSVTISGTVAGAPGVTVALAGDGSATVTTDASGRYEFQGLARGGYTVTPSLAGYVFAPSARSVTVGSADVLSQDFTATSGLAWDQGDWDQTGWH
jgi:multidrug efflux pump subunit AcrA (membrane-fusion protein)